MQAVIRFIRNEPAIVVSTFLAVANIFGNFSEGQTEAIRNIVESAIILLGGTVVRQNVSPTAGN